MSGSGNDTDPAAAGRGAVLGYGRPAGYQPRTEGRAVAALLLAVVSVTVFPVVPAVAALVVAASARRAIKQSQGHLTGLRLVTAAQVVACIGLLLGLVVVGLLVAAVVALSRGGA